MTRHRSAWLVLAASVLCLSALSAPVAAQSPGVTAASQDVKRRIEVTWRVIPLQNGLLLVPRRASPRVKSIELSQGGLALDGRAVTGAELVDRLGADAAPVLQLSYLGDQERAALFAEVGGPPVERPRTAGEEASPPPVFEPRARGTHHGARIRVFGSVAVQEGEQVGDVVAVFGSVDLQGSATGDVVAVLGDVVLGPKAAVRGNVVAVGGALRAASGATTAGQITEIRMDWPEMRLTIPGDDRFSLQVTPDWPRIARVAWLSGVVGAVLLLATCVFTLLVAPGAVSASANPGRSLLLSGLVGLAIEVLLLPALVLIASALTLSVVGIPLLAGIPILLLVVAGSAIVGFTGFAARLGSAWRPGGQVRVSVVGMVAGLALILGLGLAGRYLWAASGGGSYWGLMLALAGAVVEYAAWTIGLGSAVLAWMGRRSRRTEAAAIPDTPPVITAQL